MYVAKMSSMSQKAQHTKSANILDIQTPVSLKTQQNQRHILKVSFLSNSFA